MVLPGRYRANDTHGDLVTVGAVPERPGRVLLLGNRSWQTVDMARFVQSVPALGDPYTGDPILRSHLDRRLGPDGHARARPRLAALGAAVVDKLRAAHADAESHPPLLHRYDPWGARVDRIETAPGWQVQRRAAAEHAVVALPYLHEARKSFGAGARVVQHALLHLYGPESATFSCPVAMSDGAAALLSRSEVDPAVREAWLPRLLHTDPDTAITSGQWMTESQGGSDISRSDTTAHHDEAGNWRLTGEKWFCSAADAAMAVALARPEGAGTGSRVLAPFLIPRYGADGGPASGIRLHRLKEKLGTRAVPTAEIGLRDALALPLGDPQQPGLHRMMTLVVVTRLHNAAAAAGGMRRGLDYARAYAGVRTVAGGRLDASPLHRATLGGLAVDARAAYTLAAHAFDLLGRVEVGADPAAEAELRLVAPLAKLLTGKLAVGSASEYVECFGGAGYIEETGVPRLLRDAQVLPIWEGTTNVLSLDVLRALARDEGATELLERINKAAQLAVGPAAGLLAETVTEVRERIGVATKQPARARELALRLGCALTGALLVEHAAWAGTEDWQVAAGLWAQARLGHAETAEQANRYYEIL
jgi:alkylation response protein AidB-like acyl-CoA dehydrogenase